MQSYFGAVPSLIAFAKGESLGLRALLNASRLILGIRLSTAFLPFPFLLTMLCQSLCLSLIIDRVVMQRLLSTIIGVAMVAQGLVVSKQH